MKSGDEVDLARHLAELAVNDSGQLPRVMVALVNSLWCEIAGMLEEWEESLNELI